ncbi:hypothetical protein OGAPHI_007348 [Ogataea philodendri]|uniref:Uncharacterized protein n=1 Tax=Ogataea philodendri TaxID=1378263 RepID=A0A9P8NTM2_9ASCO|nr:uncharacterized protein OGAPHI_007348 [Ogataea philodendri]KAH3660143.1 hypothetical protein OGAPHI_007348 [Ogataea philodendri]
MKKQSKVQKPAKPASNSLKQTEARKKQVFKTVLAHPFSQRNIWPAVSPELQTDVVDLLCSALREIGTYNQLSASERTKMSLKEPEISQYVLYGFNNCMKALENQAKLIRADKFDPQQDTALQYLFVCKIDMTTPLLFQHFPVLSRYSAVKLIQLPKSTNQRLQQALGLKKPTEVLVLSQGAAKMYPALAKLAGSVDDVDIGFLNNGPFKANIKHILTHQTFKK